MGYTLNEDFMSGFRHFDLTGLSTAERLLLVDELLEAAHAPAAPLTAAQLAELERRDAEADAGRVSGERWEVVRERLKRRV